ncbi:MAG: extracellular solute-binding protein [Candidatus Zambryskibacteria bacterium]|nr:extracellular solute-binding protein [Candidatus Zambryskibacteria bacterium]
MSPFKMILLGVFGFGALVGVVVFATYRGGSSQATGPVVVWGFLPENSMNLYAKEMGFEQNKQFSFVYVEKDPQTFESDFVKALADGQSPDIVIMREDMLALQKSRLLVIPYTSYKERDFKNSFVESTEFLLSDTGLYGLPLYADPLVMYWNRTLYTNASLSVAPKYWDEFLTLPNKLTKKDNTGTVTQSAIALGEWKNITHAKEILANLLLQGGTSIVSTLRNGESYSTLMFESNQVSPAYNVLNFYTQFANPVTAQYSWNRSLPSSQNQFILGDLASYLGLASEVSVLRAKNPNLNFDIALSPQPRQSEKTLVFSHVYSLVIPKQAKNVAGAFQVISLLASEAGAKVLESYTNLPPVRRGLLSDTPSDPYKAVFYQSAIQSTTWPDPDRKETNTIFQNMIESITSGRLRITDALRRADEEVKVLLPK